jgi:pyrimidine operon attenuation protein / uracil phosphoribosyltransferase
MLVLDKGQIADTIERISDDIVNSISSDCDIAVVGIRRKGIFVGQRLAASLSNKLARPIECGSTDITLHRDDVHDPEKLLKMAPTDIPFDIDGKTLILVDDVLHTGRSCRAAMDAVIEFGRPAAIKLAALVERGKREFPIQADYVGIRLEVEEGHRVVVLMQESDGVDSVDIVENTNY